ncbi:FecR family protein [Caulobacter sp.]|uniref:FecR family protein n=1 Tax=Caulobacter sp. TaxID=78 RepID=UPI003BAD594A
MAGRPEGGRRAADEAVAPSRRGLLRAAVASGAVLAVGGGLIGSRAYAWSAAKTDVGETRLLRLPDGSELILNTDSAVAWKFDRETRAVRLKRGEVALNVRPGATKLALISEGLTADLSEGRFNARLKAGTLNVTVLSGVAQPGSTSDPSSLRDAAAKDQTLLLTDTAASVRPVSSQQVAATLAWQDGEILFQDEPLTSAVEEYNRYLSAKIVIMDTSLGGIRVGGRFTTTNPASFLEALREILDIDVQTTNENYLLTRKNNSQIWRQL